MESLFEGANGIWSEMKRISAAIPPKRDEAKILFIAAQIQFG